MYIHKFGKKSTSNYALKISIMHNTKIYKVEWR